MTRQQGVMGAAVLLGLLVSVVPGRADETAAIEAIKKEGGRVRVDTKQPGKPVVWVDFARTRIADAELKILMRCAWCPSYRASPTRALTWRSRSSSRAWWW